MPFSKLERVLPTQGQLLEEVLIQDFAGRESGHPYEFGSSKKLWSV